MTTTHWTGTKPKGSNFFYYFYQRNVWISTKELCEGNTAVLPGAYSSYDLHKVDIV